MPRTNGPWTILSTRHPYRDEFIEVAVDRVIQPDGERGQYATVQMKPGVTVLPIDDEGRVVLVRQFRYALGAESLEAPAGGIDEGESPLEAARRELREEVGIEATDWTALPTVTIDTSIVLCPDHLFIARGLSLRKPDREGTEEMETVRVPLADAVAMVLRGEIVLASSCLLLLLAARMEEERGTW